ncbi:MAG: M13 family peptidase [Aeromicrobium sp.]|nr:M13 family peptidase [Burkholderiales bacterium]
MSTSKAATVVPTSGIDRKNMDKSVRPQDDFYAYTNGAWLKNTVLPADKSRWGSFDELRDLSVLNMRAIIDGKKKEGNLPSGSEAQKIVDLYDSFMDEALRETLGASPLKADLARIDAMKDKSKLAEMIASMNQMRVTAPIGMGVVQDRKDATQYVVGISQSGLGLPDRDYYLNNADAKIVEVRTKYQALIEKMFAATGDAAAAAAASARAVVALETEIARGQWTRVENRNPVKTYNRIEVAKLYELAPGYDWNMHLAAAGVEGKVSSLVVSQPSYLTAFGKLAEATPVGAWKAYFKWHVISRYAPFLSKSFVDDSFAFTGTVLRGVPANEDNWKLGVRLVDGSLGDALGKLYVAKHFPPENKARMEKLVDNLKLAFGQSIDSLDWMSPTTKQEARKKLATMNPKIGYTNKWRDYSEIKIVKGDLIANVKNVAAAEYKRNISRLGKPVDRTEWGMTPQTVNASYSPLRNEITFPAAILQPPFFDAAADDAVNYGAIGGVIGHEIGHGFDDAGSQYDEVGNLRDWWTAEDRERFSAKTKVLIAQYSSYSPIAGYNVNGALSLGENIGDNSGLAIAYKAYKLSLGGKEGPVIDGFTGDQRLFLGWAQVWRTASRDDAMILQLKTGPHAPGQVRGTATVRNQPGFYGAFGVKEGDKMYLAPEQRVTIW